MVLFVSLMSRLWCRHENICWPYVDVSGADEVFLLVCWNERRRRGGPVEVLSLSREVYVAVYDGADLTARPPRSFFEPAA